MSLGTIETKVIAGAAGSGVGAAAGGFLLWLAGVLIWHQPDTASAAAATVAAVPTPVSGLVLILLAVAGSAISGYAAPHTNVTAGAHSADSVPAGAAVTPASLATVDTSATIQALLTRGDVPPFQDDSADSAPAPG